MTSSKTHSPFCFVETMANMKNKRSLLALVALALCSAILLSAAPASASPRAHLATSKHTGEFAQQVRNGQEKRLVGDLPVVGDLTKELPIPLRQEKRLVGDLPIVGDLTKDLPVPLKREERRLVGDLPVVGDLTKELPIPLKRGEKRLVGGLPIVGGLTNDLPVVDSLTEDLPLVGGLTKDLPVPVKREEKRLVDGLPIVGDLTKDLPIPLKREHEKRLVGGLLESTAASEKDTPLVDALVGDHLDLNALTSRSDEEEDDEPLINGLIGDKLNLNALTARDEDDEPLIDALIGNRLDLNVLTDSPEKRLVGNVLESLPLVGGKQKAEDAKTAATTGEGVAPASTASTASTPATGKGVAGILPLKRAGMLGGLTDSLPTKSLPVVGGLLPVRRASDYAKYDTLSERDTIDLTAANGAEKRSQHMGDGKLTWYAGHEMDAPACGGAKPTDHSYIVAVNEKLKGHCGKTVRLTHGGKTLNAKVVDWCGNCPIRHLDASKAVFGYFADLSQGEVHGMDFTFVGDEDPEAHKLGPLDVSVYVHHHHSS